MVRHLRVDLLTSRSSEHAILACLQRLVKEMSLALHRVPATVQTFWFTEGFDTADVQDAKALLDAFW
jgi:hypothetical protein